MGVKKYEDNDTDDQITKGIMLVDGKVVQPQIPRVTHPAYFQEILIMSTSRNIQPV